MRKQIRCQGSTDGVLFSFILEHKVQTQMHMWSIRVEHEARVWKPPSGLLAFFYLCLDMGTDKYSSALEKGDYDVMARLCRMVYFGS